MLRKDWQLLMLSAAGGVAVVLMIGACGGCVFLITREPVSQPVQPAPVALSPVHEPEEPAEPEPQEPVLTDAELKYIVRWIPGKGGPQMDPRKMVTGDVGHLQTTRVIQVVDSSAFLADYLHATVLMVGVDTSDMVDGRKYQPPPNIAFECIGPQSYENVLGAKRTIMAVVAFDVTKAQELAAEEAFQRQQRFMESEAAGDKN